MTLSTLLILDMFRIPDKKAQKQLTLAAGLDMGFALGVIASSITLYLIVPRF